MNVRETKRFVQDEETGLFSGTLSAVIAELQKVRDALPTEFREVATYEIRAQEDYGSPYAEILITYERPETEYETRVREVNTAARQAAQDAQERAQYERLSAKFGAPA